MPAGPSGKPGGGAKLPGASGFTMPAQHDTAQKSRCGYVRCCEGYGSEVSQQQQQQQVMSDTTLHPIRTGGGSLRGECVV
jgi:hypothetical protein